MSEQTIKAELKMDKKREQLLNAPVEKLVCKMAIPTIISMLVTALYNLADTFFVGRLNSNSATGAVGVVFALMAIVQACGFFFGHGSGNYISTKIGEGEYEEAEKMAATGFFSSIFAGMVLALVGLIFQKPLARLLGATDTMMDDTLSYMRYILISTPYMMASLVLNNQLRLQGNSLFSMIGLVSGALFNIALDPLLIFTFDMGVAGAALATIISQFISFVVLFIGCQRSSSISIRWKNFTLEKRYYAEIWKGGIPSLGRQGLASVATLVLNNFAGAYGDGDEVIAAFSVVTRITNIAFSVIIGFGQGFQPVCGFNYGAKKYDRVERAVWFSVKVSSAFLLVAAIFTYAFAPELVRLFRDDEEVIAIGVKAIRYQCFSLPTLGFIVAMNMLLQNIRKTVPASILAMARQGLVFIPTLLILSGLWGLVGLQAAQAVADFLTFIVAIPLSFPTLKELRANGSQMEKNFSIL